MDSPISNDECSSAGSIHSLTLINFMCHSYLNIRFESGVNFVVGSNGSGKSAILTGLIVALGGKASATFRGGSLKDFIKQGESFGEVTVKLNNRGKESFSQNVYGDMIIINRRITVNGVTSYKIMSFDNRVISTSKENLLPILDHFNIQVENPLCVLTQDVSRNFLHSTSAGNKFEFFMKASNLIQIKKEYTLIDGYQRDLNNYLKTKVEILTKYQKKVSNLKLKLDAAEKLESFKEIVNKLEIDRFWAITQVKKNEYTRHQKELEQIAQKVEAVVEKMKKQENLIQTQTQSHQELITLYDHTKKCAENLCKENEELIAKCNQVKNQMHQIERNKTLFLSELKSYEASNRTFQNRISQISNETDGNNKLSVRVQQAEQRIISNRKELEKSKEFLKNNETLSLEYGQKISQLSVEMFSLSHNERLLSGKIRDLKQKISNISTSSASDHLLRYGSWCKRLNEMIEEGFENGEFEKKPIGPIGANIEISDQKWEVCVECCLKKLLGAYCVHSFSDKDKLQKLFKQVGTGSSTPIIIVTKFKNETYDVSRNTVNSANLTMLNVITSKHPTVINILIDQLSIEKILCIHDVESARRIMIPVPPKNAIKAFTCDGDEIIAGQGGSSRFYSNKRANISFLSQSSKPDLSSQRSELKITEENLSIEKQKISQLKLNIKSFEVKRNQVVKSVEHVSLEIQSLQTKIRKDEQFLDEYQLSDLSSLEQQMEQINIKIKALNVEIEKCSSKLSELETKKNELSSQCEEKNSEIEKVKAKYSELRIKINEQKEVVLREKNQLESVKKIHQLLSEKLKIVEDKNSLLKNEFMVAHKNALKFGEERVVEKEVSQISEEIEKYKQTIAMTDCEHKEEVLVMYKDLREKISRLCDTVKSTRKITKNLELMMNERHQRYKSIQNYIAVRLQYFFTMILSQRGFEGKLVLDYEKCELSLLIKVKEDSTLLSDSRALSGGERSFSSLAFILSLWETMESPFRCLDEFDVFMDMVNRQISFNLLLEYAQCNPQCQLIIFTPNDISGLVDEKAVSIFKMSNPRDFSSG